MTKKELGEIQKAVSRIELGERSFHFSVGGNYFDVSDTGEHIEISSLGGELDDLRVHIAMILLELGNTSLKRIFAQPGNFKIIIEP